MVPFIWQVKNKGDLYGCSMVVILHCILNKKSCRANHQTTSKGKNLAKKRVRRTIQADQAQNQARKAQRI